MSNLTLGADLLTNWTMYSLSIDEAVMRGLLGEKEPALFDPPQPADLSPPAFYGGSFVIPDGIPDLPQDTYIKLSSWRKARDMHRSFIAHTGANLSKDRFCFSLLNVLMHLIFLVLEGLLDR